MIPDPNEAVIILLTQRAIDNLHEIQRYAQQGRKGTKLIDSKLHEIRKDLNTIKKTIDEPPPAHRESLKP